LEKFKTEKGLTLAFEDAFNAAKEQLEIKNRVTSASLKS